MKQTTACGILHSQEYWISIDFLESCLHIFRNLISYWTIKRKGKNIEHIFQVMTHEGSYFSYLTIFWRKKLYYETIAFLCPAEFCNEMCENWSKQSRKWRYRGYPFFFFYQCALSLCILGKNMIRTMFVWTKLKKFKMVSLWNIFLFLAWLTQKE